jgi:uncharacterized protein
MSKRLAPALPFPSYSYVTGQFPHPTRDKLGHSFGHPPRSILPLDPEAWQVSQEYLFALDLFNHGYYWEAHEAWEELWHACGRTGVMADFLKGLIKFAAAGVKVREGRSEGVRRHARRAIELLQVVQGAIGTDNLCGLNLQQLITIAERLAIAPPVSTEKKTPVEIVFDFQLEPQSTAGRIVETDPR